MQDPALPGLHRYTVQYNTVHNVYNYVVTLTIQKYVLLSPTLEIYPP